MPGSFQHFDLDRLVTSEPEFRVLIPPTGAVTHCAAWILVGKEEGGSGRLPLAHALLRHRVILAPTCCRAARLRDRSQVKLLPDFFYFS